MKLILLLPVVIAVKIIISKGLMLVLILLSFWVKGKSIKMSPDRWSNYFLTLNEQFVNRYVAVVYGISAVLSAYIAYLLFKVFGFHRPVFNAVILAVVCAVLFGIRYRKKGKRAVQEGLVKINESVANDG